MKGIIVDILLGLAVTSAWVATFGFVRLKWALDRLHVVAFATIACGLPVVGAAFVEDGPSTRAFKILLLWVVTLTAGASVNQAIGRAIFNRNEAGERT